jgi:hypothetical protein
MQPLAGTAAQGRLGIQESMNALDLIREAGLPPDQLAVVENAFQVAWTQVKPQLRKEDSAERARIRLAGIVLLFTRIIKDDPDRLETAALRAYFHHD